MEGIGIDSRFDGTGRDVLEQPERYHVQTLLKL